MTGKMFDYDEAAAARILEMTPKTLARYRQRGAIAHYRLPGGRIRYSAEQLTEFVRSTVVPARRVLESPDSSEQRAKVPNKGHGSKRRAPR